jgi:hypothetical protein
MTSACIIERVWLTNVSRHERLASMEMELSRALPWSFAQQHITPGILALIEVRQCQGRWTGLDGQTGSSCRASHISHPTSSMHGVESVSG